MNRLLRKLLEVLEAALATVGLMAVIYIIFMNVVGPIIVRIMYAIVDAV